MLSGWLVILSEAKNLKRRKTLQHVPVNDDAYEETLNARGEAARGRNALTVITKRAATAR
jgi:hypothetical protein